MTKSILYKTALVTIIGVMAPCLLANASFANEARIQTYAEVKSDKFTSNETNQSFAKFQPKSNSIKSKLDYSIWDEALEKVVIDLGPSTRLRAKSATASIGSRFVKGHKTEYRLEGSRFTFEYITDDYAEGLTDYRLDLQDIATKHDITRFSKDEQLAFWLNLYNVATIEKIADAYPIERPDRIKIKVNGVKYSLEDAPFINVLGQDLSLKDIRENIVYRYWNDPVVIYGFFRGEIGGPILQRYAFTGDRVDEMLSQNADDFVNSLRGFNLGHSTRYVSELYQESAAFFFPDFENDLVPHLTAYANETVRSELANPFPIKVERYDNVIADLSRGARLGSSGAPTNTGPISAEILRMLREVEEKRDYQIRRGDVNRNKGFVIIEDLVPEEDKVQESP